MLAANGKITMRQLQILIILSAMGTGIIVLPRRVAEFAGQDGWIIAVGLIVLAVLIGLLISSAVITATKTKPEAGFIEFTGDLLTRPVAYICGIALWLKLVLSAGLELRIFMEITQSIMLPQTPLAAVSAAVLFVCAYAAAKGMEARARVAEILFAVMALPFIFLVALAFFDTNFANLQPVMVTPPGDLLHGTLALGFIFTGLECLLLVSPFIKKNRRHMGRYVAGALGFAGGVILLITVLTIAKFGRGVANQPWPVLRMMDMLNIPGSFIERQEALMFSFWIITAFAIGNMMLFFGGLLVKDMFKPTARHLGVIVTTLAVFAVSIFPWEDVYGILDFIYLTAGVFFMVVLPTFLLIAAKLRSVSRQHRNNVKTAAKSSSLIIIFVAGTFFLTGCWDRVEIENRAFVVAIGIDNKDGEYAVSLTVPLLQKDSEEEKEGEPHRIKTATGQTVTEALKKLDAKTDKTLYYGQAKLLILGNDLLSNADMTSSVINAMKNKSDIDLRINVLAAEGSAKDILEAKPPGETLPGLYVADIYRNKNKLGGASFALDLERLSTSYNDGAVIPIIAQEECEGSPLKLDGAAAIKHRHKIGKLTQEELQGFLWCLNHGNNGAVVTVKNYGELIPIKIQKHAAKVSFEPAGANNENLRAIINIKVIGHIEEPPEDGSDISKIERMLEYEIKTEIFGTVEVLKKKYGLDGWDWLEVLRQKNYSLYKVHSHNWEDVFPEIEVVPKITVEVEEL